MSDSLDTPSQFSDNYDDNWVFESLVNFLHGAVWKLPVLNFIDEKSVVFDPESFRNMTDEKEIEYRKIHEEYKDLVDLMLVNFMEDIQVSPEQVEQACKIRETGKLHADSHITKICLEQLQAADNFNVFRRLMTRKNIDLQLQSLELLVSKCGILSPSLRNIDSGSSEDTNNDDEEFLQVVIRQIQQQEEEEESSLPEGCTDAGGEETESQLQGVEQKKLLSNVTTEMTPISAIPALKRKPEVKWGLEPVDDETKLQLDDISTDFIADGTVGSEDIQRRREYMRIQRDKLVEIKRKEREMELTNIKARGQQPVSSNATSVKKTGYNEGSLVARRALANRLKHELQ